MSCDVCGRTLLRGEQADVFLAGGTRRNVCELCTQRASHEGWIREGLDDATVRSRAHNGRSRSFLARLRQRRADAQALHEELESVEGAEEGVVGPGSVVTIVVGWELSWYRFEVDLADEAAGPRITGQGTELAELDAADQVPNAAADDHGQLHLVAQHA